MGHYDNCRDGYCPKCGAAPGNIKNGVCEICHPKGQKYTLVQRGDFVLHLKTGGRYYVSGLTTLKHEDPVLDGTPCVQYYLEGISVQTYTRPLKEFTDGRFRLLGRTRN